MPRRKPLLAGAHGAHSPHATHRLVFICVARCCSLLLLLCRFIANVQNQAMLDAIEVDKLLKEQAKGK